MISEKFKPLLVIITTICFLSSFGVCFSVEEGGDDMGVICVPRSYGNIRGLCAQPDFASVIAYYNGHIVSGQRFEYYKNAGSCPFEFAHEYTIFNLSPGTYDFYIFATGYVTQVHRNVTVPGSLPIVLLKEAKISGTVTVNGNPIEKIVVSAYNNSGIVCGMGGITNATGAYTIPELPAGTYTVKTFDPNYDFSPYQGVVTTGGQTTSGINLTGTPRPPLPSGILSGMVSKISIGAGIEGVSVFLYDSENKSGGSAETDADGHYEVKFIPPGTYTVKVNSGIDSGFVDIAQAQNVVIANDQTTAQDFSVSIGSISGSVTYSDQAPVVGATLMASSGNQNYSTETASDGHYTFNNVLPGTYQVNLVVNGHFEVRQINNIVVAANSNISGQNFTITSVPTGQISGIVTCSQGPLANASVSAFNENLDLSNASTNANGTYTIAGLPVGTYYVAASSNGYVSGSQTGVVVTAGQTSSDHNFTLGTEGGAISGTVYRPDGTTPIAGAQISCYSPGKSTGVATTDENGVYSISLLQAGAYDIAAIAAGYKPKTLNNVAVTVPGTNSGNNFILEAQ